MPTTLITSAFALLLAAGASAQSVFVVAPVAGPGVFSTDIQPAVDAAANGDLVLVKAGDYSGFTISAKGVSVVADAGAAVVADGDVLVINVSASQRVLLQGLTVHGDAAAPALVTQGSMGAIWIESCDVTGGTQIGPGLVAVSVNSCPAVVIQRSLMTGGNAMSGGTQSMGGPALHVANSKVAVGDSQCLGGNGAAPVAGGGGFGGPGLRVLTGSVFASGTSFQGGAGAAPVPPTFPGGPGGPGINTEAPVTTLQCTFAGGPGFPNGAPTVVIGAGSVTILPDVARHFSITSPVREGQALTITAGGVPGEIAWFLFAPSPATPIALLLPFEGSLALPAGASSFALGMIPGGGTLSTPPIVVPNLPAALQSATIWCQSLDFGSPHAVLGPTSALVLLDAAL
jgi:hypothetical protein